MKKSHSIMGLVIVLAGLVSTRGFGEGPHGVAQANRTAQNKALITSVNDQNGFDIHVSRYVLLPAQNGGADITPQQMALIKGAAFNLRVATIESNEEPGNTAKDLETLVLVARQNPQIFLAIDDIAALVPADIDSAALNLAVRMGLLEGCADQTNRILTSPEDGLPSHPYSTDPNQQANACEPAGNTPLASVLAAATLKRPAESTPPAEVKIKNNNFARFNAVRTAMKTVLETALTSQKAKEAAALAKAQEANEAGGGGAQQQQNDQLAQQQRMQQLMQMLGIAQGFKDGAAYNSKLQPMQGYPEAAKLAQMMPPTFMQPNETPLAQNVVQMLSPQLMSPEERAAQAAQFDTLANQYTQFVTSQINGMTQNNFAAMSTLGQPQNRSNQLLEVTRIGGSGMSASTGSLSDRLGSTAPLTAPTQRMGASAGLGAAANASVEAPRVQNQLSPAGRAIAPPRALASVPSPASKFLPVKYRAQR